MIDVKELRIGNWVEVLNKTVQVKWICPKNVGDTDGEDYDILTDNNHGCLLRDLFAIHLTPEILGKCGFNKWAGPVYHADGMHTWRLEWDEKNKNASFRTDVYLKIGHAVWLPGDLRFVHQLQNTFFSLFGKELQINL